MTYKLRPFVVNIYTLQPPIFCLKTSLIIYRMRLFPDTKILYPVVLGKKIESKKFFIFIFSNFSWFYVKYTDESNHQHIKYSVSMRKNTVFVVTILIFLNHYHFCFFCDNLQRPTLFINLFQIFLFIMTQNIENNTTPMEIEGDEIDPTVRAIDLHLIESAKFVEVITQGRKFEY